MREARLKGYMLYDSIYMTSWKRGEKIQKVDQWGGNLGVMKLSQPCLW